MICLHNVDFVQKRAINPVLRSLFIARCEVCVHSELKIIGCRMNISFRIREWGEAGGGVGGWLSLAA
jgi:hypothetical protein